MGRDGGGVENVGRQEGEIKKFCMEFENYFCRSWQIRESVDFLGGGCVGEGYL